MNSFAKWEGATGCTGSASSGARALLAWISREYPEGRSMGIYNCRQVRGAQAHSIHSEGRALDWGMPMVGGKGSPQGHAIVQRLARHGLRLGIQSIIYDRKIWSASSPNGRNYLGVAPHYDHLHIELTRNAARHLNVATLDAVLGTSTPKPQTPAVCEQQVLRVSSTGVCVEQLQRKLNEKGHSVGRVDGDFGPATDRAVRSFQSASRITADGVVGPQTWSKLNEQPAPAPAPTPAPAPAPTVPRVPVFAPPAACTKEVLRIRSKGKCVTSLQRRLNTLGFNAGAPDGVFGAKTEDAVKRFQRSKRLTADGIVGPKTWEAL